MSYVTDESVTRRYRGTRPLRLTTADAEGRQRTTSLPYLPDGERSLLIAVGRPAWFEDLRERPRVGVALGSLHFPADAAVLDEDERDRVLARAVEADTAWAGEVEGRPVAVVALTPVFEGMPDKIGDHLVRIHDAFRAELAAIRQDLAGAGPALVAQLKINCLTFCHDLHGHHTMESQGMFPRLAEAHTGLRPALERLEREHEVIKRILDELQELVRGDRPKADLLAEFDRLAAELETHLTYEEEQLVAALNEVTFGA